MKPWFELVALGLLALGGCLLFPPVIQYQSILTPVPDAEHAFLSAPGLADHAVIGETLQGQYALRQANVLPKEAGVIAYQMEGCRIEVEYMTDEALNAFPTLGNRGLGSAIRGDRRIGRGTGEGATCPY